MLILGLEYTDAVGQHIVVQAADDASRACAARVSIRGVPNLTSDSGGVEVAADLPQGAVVLPPPGGDLLAELNVLYERLDAVLAHARLLTDERYEVVARALVEAREGVALALGLWPA